MKDINGNLIYEGDIIKLPSGKMRYVFYGVTSFRHTKAGECAKDLQARNDYKIIGNIFDNPEMLNKGELQ